jgi:hypothetical protein
MSDTILLKVLLVVLLLVESDDSCHSNVLEDVDILVWMVAISMTLITVLDWSHKGSKLTWNNPVEVAIFDSLIVLIFFHVESSEIIPAESYGILESLKNVEKSTVEEAIALGGISVMLE